MGVTHAVALCLAAAWLALVPVAGRAEIPVGKARLTVDVNGLPLEIHTYKPQGSEPQALLLVLHGVGRNASGYRDHAAPLADRGGFLVIAPLFDSARFPTWRYQWGGIVRSGSQCTSGAQLAEPEPTWTGRLLIGIVDAIRMLERAPALEYYLLGHSGGAQALSRIAAFMPMRARRIVLANAGTYLSASREAPFPYGFAGLPDALASEAALRAYLAQPITILLGTADILQDADLSMREGAAQQGANRYERGLNAYRAAQALAKARGWTFNWKLIEVPGVAHSAARMFRSDQAFTALASANEAPATNR
jgi:pimeloyl-ACP methyl ester carboxylesterase